MKKLIERVFSSDRIFLIDGLGAILSAVMLGVVLPAFVPFFGMPTAVLYPLASAATIMAIYSLICHFLKPARYQIFLRGIAALNLGYCLTSVVAMYLYWPHLTVWGTLYFVSEKIIVLSLVSLELYLSTSKKVN